MCAANDRASDGSVCACRRYVRMRRSHTAPPLFWRGLVLQSLQIEVQKQEGEEVTNKCVFKWTRSSFQRGRLAASGGPPSQAGGAWKRRHDAALCAEVAHTPHCPPIYALTDEGHLVGEARLPPACVSSVRRGRRVCVLAAVRIRKGTFLALTFLVHPPEWTRRPVATKQ